MHCYICYTKNLDPEWVCDSCEQHYCEDCSYTFSLYYQYEGNLCHWCADQSRRNRLTIEVIRNNKIKLFSENE